MLEIKKQSLKNADEQLIVIFCDVNGRAYSKTVHDVIQKFNLRELIDNYVNDKKYSPKDINGSVQSLILRKERKIFLCVYAVDDCGEIDFENLELGLINVGRRSRAPVAMALNSHSNMQVSAKIRALACKYLKDCDLIMYKGV